MGPLPRPSLLRELPAHRLRRQRRRAQGDGRVPAGRPAPVAHRRGQRHQLGTGAHRQRRRQGLWGPMHEPSLFFLLGAKRLPICISVGLYDSSLRQREPTGYASRSNAQRFLVLDPTRHGLHVFMGQANRPSPNWPGRLSLTSSLGAAIGEQEKIRPSLLLACETEFWLVPIGTFSSRNRSTH